MPATIGNLRERLSQVAALIEAAQLAANGLPQDQSAPMRTLLQFAADKLTGARAHRQKACASELNPGRLPLDF